MINLKLKNIKNIKDSQPILERLFKKHKQTYISLFFHELDTSFDRFNLNPLIRSGILRKIGKKYRANVQVFPFSGMFICTDFLISLHKIINGRFARGKNDVWAIFAYESPYIAKKAIVKRNDVVLDLATGSGIIALLCAKKAKNVIATDINPKALHYARFNAILNNLENKIEFRLGDLFEPVKNLKFDSIIWNGPTISVPNAPKKYPIYCFGGSDGLEFTRRFIEEAPHYLTKNGKMQWLDPSIGTASEPESLRIIRNKWRHQPFNIIYERRVHPSDLFKTIKYIDKILIEHPLKGKPRPLWIRPLTQKEYTQWINFLQKNHFTHIHAGMYKVYRNKKFRISITQPKKIIFARMNQLPEEWHFLSSGRIKQLLRVCEQY